MMQQSLPLPAARFAGNVDCRLWISERGGGGGDYDKKVLDSVLRYAALSQRVRELAEIGNKDKDKA